MASSSSSSVQVVVRLRPLNDKELQHGTLPVVAANTNSKSITVLKGQQGSRHQQKLNFQFDNVFGTFSTQQDVFDATLRPVIRDVLLGFESTVFAYGSTGTGKTHTMEGSLDDPEQFGVIPRSAAAIFAELQTNPEYVASKVSCSFLEIYNEDLNDLLVDNNNNNRAATAASSKQQQQQQSSSSSQSKLSIMEGKNGPFCRGLSEVAVQSAEDLLELMRTAQQQRQVGETNMNKQSSRSHCIFTLKVSAKRQLPDGSVLDSTGKLHCCDLAGSECAKSANLVGEAATGEQQQAARERERMNINRSLLTLGRVVSTLKELSQNPNKKSVRIPYRDSKLTRILQESLGGKCKTCVIATLSPSVTAIEESLSTLSYASAANGIVNKPVTTSFMTAGTGPVGAGVDKKSPTIEGGAGSVEHWHEMEVRLEYMKAQVEEAQQALARKHIQHQEIVDRAEQAEQAQKVAESKLEDATQQVHALQSQVEETNTQLHRTETVLKETTLVLQATQQTEARLTSEAKGLISVLQETILNRNEIHQSLLEKHKAEVVCKNATRTYRDEASGGFQNISTAMAELELLQNSHSSNVTAAYSKEKKLLLSRLNDHKTTFDDVVNSFTDKSRTLRGTIHDALIPSFQTFAVNLKADLDALDSMTVECSQSLKAHCKVIAERLDNTLLFMEEEKLRYQAASSFLQSNIGNDLSAFKELLSNACSRLQELIANATHERGVRRTNLQKVLRSWKESCHDSMDANQSLAHGHVERMKEVFESLMDEKDYRKDILSHFSQQNSVLSASRGEYIRELEQQQHLLQQQNEALLNAQQLQLQRNDAMAKNIMATVQSIVEKEVAEACSLQKDAMDEFSTRYIKLTAGNKKLSSHISRSMEALRSSNINTSTKVQTFHERQDAGFAALQSESLSFSNKMEQNLENGRTAVDGLAAESVDMVAAMNSEDLANSETTSETLTKDLESCRNNISKLVDRSVSQGLSSLKESYDSVSQHVQDSLIAHVRSDLVNEIQVPQATIGASMKSGLEKIHVDLSSEEQSIEQHCNKNLEVAMGMQKAIEEAHVGFCDSVTNHMSAVQNSSWLEESMEATGNVICEMTQLASKTINDGKEQLHAFVGDVIRVDEESVPVKDLSVPVYSEQLSTTPHPDVIIGRATCNAETMCKENHSMLSSIPSSSFVIKSNALKEGNRNSDKSSPSLAGKRPADKAAFTSRLGKKTKS